MAPASGESGAEGLTADVDSVQAVHGLASDLFAASELQKGDAAVATDIPGAL
jgi:hypothetical protein